MLSAILLGLEGAIGSPLFCSGDSSWNWVLQSWFVKLLSAQNTSAGSFWEGKWV